jgi:hypothetical protein
MAQFLDPVAIEPTLTKIFCATAVFGVDVVDLNVTVLDEPLDHEPVNVQTRKTLPDTDGIGWSKVSPG